MCSLRKWHISIFVLIIHIYCCILSNDSCACECFGKIDKTETYIFRELNGVIFYWFMLKEMNREALHKCTLKLDGNEWKQYLVSTVKEDVKSLHLSWEEA